MADHPVNPIPDPVHSPVESGFLSGKRFPEPAPPTREPESFPEAGNSSGFFSRIVLPIVLFVLIVGGIAWLSQYMPNWRSRTKTVDMAVPIVPAKELLAFLEKHSVWDPEDPKYVLAEVERNSQGHYDYPFENVSGQPVEFGLERTSCDCSKVQVALFPNKEAAAKDQPKWQDLERSSDKGVVVPADSAGKVRLTWTVRKEEGSRLNLGMVVWARPPGKANQVQTVNLDTRVGVVAPIMFLKDPIQLGMLTARDSARDEVLAWSATRSEVDLAVNEARKDPLLDCRIIPLNQEERANMEKMLRGNDMVTRVKAAFRIPIALYEEREGRQLDQGPFRRRLPLLMDGIAYEGGPMIHASIRGEVEVGSADDQGKAQLRNFKAREGTRRVVPLYSDGKLTLEYQSHEPPYLEVKLKLNERESTVGRKKWDLEVVVPAGSPAGPFSEDAAVILRTKSSSPRLIRIPILGNAGQG